MAIAISPRWEHKLKDKTAYYLIFEIELVEFNRNVEDISCEEVTVTCGNQECHIIKSLKHTTFEEDQIETRATSQATGLDVSLKRMQVEAANSTRITNILEVPMSPTPYDPFYFGKGRIKVVETLDKMKERLEKGIKYEILSNGKVVGNKHLMNLFFI